MKEFNYSVRKAVIKDLIIIYNAMSSLQGKELEFMLFNFHFKKIIKDKDTIVLMLEVNKNQIAGFVILHKKINLANLQTIFEIAEFYIVQKFRKFNAAEALYKNLESTISSNLICAIQVNCNINSTLNQNFYVKQGFKIAKKQYIKEVY